MTTSFVGSPAISRTSWWTSPRVDVGDEHDRAAARDELLEDLRDRRLHAVDDAEAALRGRRAPCRSTS